MNINISQEQFNRAKDIIQASFTDKAEADRNMIAAFKKVESFAPEASDKDQAEARARANVMQATSWEARTRLLAQQSILEAFDIKTEVRGGVVSLVKTDSQLPSLSFEHRPTLSMFHPNARGTGSAVRFAVVPATANSDGELLAWFAEQVTIGDGRTSFPKFNWDKSVIVHFSMNDISQLLQVLRGELESIAEGKGLYHRYADRQSRVFFTHQIEPVQGYILQATETPSESPDNQRTVRFVFSPSEALGFMSAVEGQLSVVAFGWPRLFLEAFNQSADHIGK